jgi:hypothetical protein
MHDLPIAPVSPGSDESIDQRLRHDIRSTAWRRMNDELHWAVWLLRELRGHLG